ncbi:putative xylosidase/arabinosidase [Aspergillus campestris IBT 28561]|uniref:Xylosidase/arabinosidase n=1 Tax=Aspergillus campestris (strain IBT 28561) TaxID=1392248 RepID=A0A2I1D0C1_ASPC2|nr:putative xylosidase/arabinosidase [Aspergillus campestris IBT 28561]PKY03325.1 putative xylosidase/arabinosidase [Aspergillus campestris IBT 28561]
MNPTTNVKVNPKSGNPVFPGWYADPEARIFDTTYWIYPTTSTVYEAQTTLDAFSSPDLLTWTRHPHVLNITRIPWSTNRAAWAPSVVAAHSTYYMYFSAGDGAGIGVARSVTGRPDGPFEDAIGKPLVPKTIHGAQPIDAQVFIDDDASVWLYFGGWSHAVVVPLASDMVSLAGDYKEITPKGYVEGPWVLKRKGIYYFMYSVGGWGDSSYGVSYVTGPSPTGPFSTTPRKILQGDGVVGDSTGHNSVFTPDGGETYYIVYHRRPVGDTERDHRVTCIDRMEFDEEGNILPVKITAGGVEGRLL